MKNRLVKEGSSEDAGIAEEGADVAKSARHEVEKRLGQSADLQRDKQELFVSLSFSCLDRKE
ncbi:MAG: hypothetical protein IK145_06080 [Bacteroidales bacterium]|nr:hypothetical protein [Bacteroidales bacterium]